ncbi:MAG: CotH kinase family protein [Defluviitaleaceae bacterium]|nr:CotH kinase family protein [Defluviitaleaceae bacterium]
MKKIFLVLLVLMPFFSLPVFANEVQWELPVLHINSHYNPFIQERTFWHNGTLTITNTEYSLEETNIRIRGRGSSTWYGTEAKRPLRFRAEEPISLFASPYQATDWILLANYFDRSLMRNHAAFYLASQMGHMSFVPSSLFLHLYVNGEYMGVYQLTDERDTSPGRVNINWDENPALSGFFLELDTSAYQDGTEGLSFVVVNNLLYDIRYPGSSGRTPAHADYVEAYINSINRALREDTAEITNLIDLDSFVDFFIVKELFKVPEAAERSVFMFIDGQEESRRLYKGPIWDFDGAASNHANSSFVEDPLGLYVGIVNEWFRFLMFYPDFYYSVANRWVQVSETYLPRTIYNLRYLSDKYEIDFARDFERHFPGQTSDDLDYFITWLEARAAWLDYSLSYSFGAYDFWQPFIHHHIYEEPINIFKDGVLLDIMSINLNRTTLVPLSDIVNNFDNFDAEYYYPFVYGAGDLVPNHVLGGEPFLSIRLVAYALGYQVDWHENAVFITNTTLN